MVIKNESGFTILEIVTVLLIIGIVTAFVVARSTDHNTELVVQTEILKARIRYTQSMSMKSNMVYSIRSIPTGYSLYKYDPSPPGLSEQVLFPGEESMDVDLSGRGLALSGNLLVSFNSKGVPCTDAHGTVPNNGPDPITISISHVGDGSGGSSFGPEIAIQPNTGFIQ